MVLGFLCGLQGVSLAGVVALAPFYCVLINYMYRFGTLCCKIPPRKSEQGRYARKRRSFARRMLARSALSVLLIQSFVIQPFATRQACGSGRIFFAVMPALSVFHLGAGLASPRQIWTRTGRHNFVVWCSSHPSWQVCSISLICFPHVKVTLVKGQCRLLH